MEKATIRIILNILKIAAYLLTSLLCLCTIVGAYAGYIPPSLWTLPSVLILLFVPMVIALIVVGAIWLICRKWVMGVVVILSLFACGPAWRANFPLHINESKPLEGQKVLSMLQYNIYTLDNDRVTGDSISPTLSYIISTDADIVCLQESYSFRSPFMENFQSQTDTLVQMYPYRIDYGDNELMILSKYPLHSLRNRDSMESHQTPTRLADIAEIDYYGMPIIVVNVHLTSYGLNADERNVFEHVRGTRHRAAGVLPKLKESFEERAEFAEQIKQKIDSLGNRDVILCGDFNDVPGSYAYNKLLSCGMKDAYAETGFGPMVTFNTHRMYFHIDQIMYRGNNIRALSCKRGSLRSSDHFPVLTRFAVTVN